MPGRKKTSVSPSPHLPEGNGLRSATQSPAGQTPPPAPVVINSTTRPFAKVSLQKGWLVKAKKGRKKEVATGSYALPAHVRDVVHAKFMIPASRKRRRSEIDEATYDASIEARQAATQYASCASLQNGLGFLREGKKSCQLPAGPGDVLQTLEKLRQSVPEGVGHVVHSNACVELLAWQRIQQILSALKRDNSREGSAGSEVNTTPDVLSKSHTEARSGRGDTAGLLGAPFYVTVETQTVE